uniref:Uncharacterized protein n=1 Tax=Zea mays TaxID=4577 RepID=C4J195_MAIZE|nr:unknown [Zea mays]ACR35342.1 unknown [Zea mays]
MELAIVAELRLGGVGLLAVYVLPPRHKRGVQHRPVGSSLPVGILLHVAEQEHELKVEHHCDIEPLHRLWPSAELGARQVPEDVDLAVLDVEALGPLLLGEEPRLDVRLAEAVAGQVVDADAEALPHEAPAPRERDHAGPARELRLVEAGHQVLRRALAGAGRRRRRVRDLDAALAEAGREVPHGWLARSGSFVEHLACSRPPARRLDQHLSSALLTASNPHRPASPPRNAGEEMNSHAQIGHAGTQATAGGCSIQQRRRRRRRTRDPTSYCERQHRQPPENRGAEEGLASEQDSFTAPPRPFPPRRPPSWPRNRGDGAIFPPPGLRPSTDQPSTFIPQQRQRRNRRFPPGGRLRLRLPLQGRRSMQLP